MTNIVIIFRFMNEQDEKIKNMHDLANGRGMAGKAYKGSTNYCDKITKFNC